MRCSVVIPCHDGAELTRACIQSLQQQQPWRPAEILLVDNASRDHTASLDQCGPTVRVLRQDRNRGFAGGVNAGIRAATGDLVLVLNNDTQAAPNLLSELVAALTTSDRMGAVAPVSNHVKGHAHWPVGNRGATVGGRQELQDQLAARAPVQDASTLAGLCLLVRRGIFDQVGLFDERFGHGNFEDDDYCLRLRLRGYRLGIAGRAFLHHEGHATFRHLGLDLATEIRKRQGQFQAKWQADPAGQAYVAALRGDVATAGRTALLAQRCYPDWPDADWHVGYWLATAGQPRLAIPHFLALLRSCPHHTDGRLALASCQLQAGELQAALLSLSAVCSAAASLPQQVRLLSLVGELAYRCDALEEAEQAFASAREHAPNDTTLDNWLGLCHVRAERWSIAADHFERAAQRGLDIACNNLAMCRTRQHQLPTAGAAGREPACLLSEDHAAPANRIAFARLLAQSRG